MPATRASPAVFSAYSTICGWPACGVTVALNVSSPALRTSSTCGAAGSDSVWFAGPREAPSTYSTASAGSPRTRISPSTAARSSDSARSARLSTRHGLRRRRVTRLVDQHFLRQAGRDRDGERRAAAITAADADIGAGRIAAHDERAVGHAELDRADRERLARAHGDRAFEAAELRMHDRERVVPGVELGLERRAAEFPVADQDRRARRHAGHGDRANSGSSFTARSWRSPPPATSKRMRCSA